MDRMTLAELISEFADRMRGRKYAFVGAIGVRVYKTVKRTFDIDLITKEPMDFEAACLSLVGMGLREVKPKGRFAPAFARFRGEGLGADVMLKKLWFHARVRGKTIEQKITPDKEFWRDIRLRGADVFGVDVPVPKPADLAVFKAASSASPARSPLKAPHDREHALELMRRFKVSPEELRQRAKAMGCIGLIERFFGGPARAPDVETIRLSVPFDKGRVSFEVPKQNLIGVVEPLSPRAVPSPAREIKRALKEPIGSKRLRELARGKRKVAIVVTDHTRPCPDHIILPELLRELAVAGVGDISVVIGTGVHRKMRPGEIRVKFGRLPVKISNHDARKSLVRLGRTRAGGEIYINRRVASADLVIAVGVVEPHQYAGFSGGRKLVAVGVAGERTIAHTHQPKFIDAPGTRLGKLRGNPFHRELVEIASKTNLRFAVNVVLNSEQKLVKCLAGSPARSFEAAARLAQKLYIRPVPCCADVLVLGVGHPKDLNLYQASRGVTYAYFATRPAVREGGVVILAAPCPEGTGGERLEWIFRGVKSPREAVRRARLVKFDAGEQRAYMFARVLEHARVILAGSRVPPNVLKGMFIEPTPSVGEALKMAFGELGRDAKVLVIPHSLLTIPVVR